MNPRERIKAALAHRQPDRTPLDIGGSNVTTMIDTAYERLKDYLGIQARTVYMSKRSRSVILDEALIQRLDTATRPVYLGRADNRPEVNHPDGTITDEWQVVWNSAGEHYHPLRSPLAEATLNDIDSFAWPDPDDPGRLRGLLETARELHEETQQAVILSLPVGVMHYGQFLCGFDRFLMDLVVDVPFIDKLMSRFLEVYLRLIGNALDATGAYVDAVVFCDDLGFQDRPMISPVLYRKLIKPRHRQIIDLIKSKTSAALVFHSCGAVYDLIPDFIEIGVDALNPIQVSAKGMGDTARLKREFGRDLCFWGAIDTQHVLPHGTPEQVREEVKRRIADLAVDGGYVVSAVHDIQGDVPPENILALAEAVNL